MQPDDKIAVIDALPENVELAKLAEPILVGIIAHPDTAPVVRDIFGDLLALPKRGLTFRASSFTRTLWAAVCELLDGGRPLHPSTIELQTEAIATRKRAGWLDAWTSEHVEIFRTMRRQHAPDLLVPSQVTTLATDWACEAHKRCELSRLALGLSKSLQAGAPVDIGDELSRMQESASKCVRASAIPTHNLGQLFAEWRADMTSPKLASGYTSIDEKNYGIDVGVTLIAGRSGSGKTQVLEGFAFAQAFPNTAKAEFQAVPAKRIEPNRDPERAYVLFLSVEMPRGEMLSRIAASLLLVHNSDLARDKEKAVQDTHVREDGAAYADMLAAIEEHGRLTLLDAEMLGSTTPRAVCSALEAWALRVREQDPTAKLVACTDYLQFLDVGSDDDKQTHEKVSAAMRQIMQVSTSHKIASLVGVQCADGQHATQRHDIRASKAVIDDAKAVWMIRRHDETPTLLQLYSDKARGAADKWTVDLYFDGRYSLLTDASTFGAAQPESKIVVKAAAKTNPFQLPPPE